MPKNSRYRLALGVSLLSISIALSSADVSAQDVDSAFTLEPIIVTGEKRSRDLMETASSVAVLDGEAIEEQKPGRHDVSTVIAGTPNVVYNESVSAPIIRGQNSEGPHTGANAFFGGTVPRATINLDGHYLDYNELYFGATSVWDIDSIEVFRGPQTTSQGANAIAGAIIVNTNDPVFSTERAFRLEYGSYNTRRASLMWNAPLSDSLAARIALDYSSRDTFIDYNGAGFIQNEIGQNFETFNGRAKLLWQPVEVPGLELMLTYSHTDTTRPSAEGASPPYEDLDSITIWMPGWHQITDTGIFDASYAFANGLMLSNQFQYSYQDIDRRVGTPTAGDADIERKNWSNETKLTFGSTEDRLSGVAGLYYARVKQNDTLNQGGISTFEDNKENLGLYGELSWRIDDRWSLTGGLRYQRDDVRRTGIVSPLFANSDLDFDATFEELLPKVSISYEVNDDVTVGALVSKGYNPGGVSLDFVSSKEWEEYEAETVWNYELFTRASLLDNRLDLTANAFYMDYTDAQHSITQTIGGTTYIHTINADKSETYGLEFSLDYRPTDRFQVNMGAGLLHTEITEFSNATDYEGNEFARAPSKMLTLGMSWEATDRLTIAGQARFVDGYYSDTQNQAIYSIEGYTLADLNATYALNNGVEVYGYINNIFDERTPILKQAARGTVAFTQASMTTPRTIGLGVRARF